MSVPADLQTTLERIEQRLARIEDRDAIQELQNQYGFFLDNRMWDEVAELFCADSPSMEIGQRGNYIGKERIRTFLTDVLGQGRWGLQRQEIIHHIQLQTVITLAADERSAQARCRALVQGNSPPGSGGLLLAEGLYENDYVKVDGQWFIKRLWWVPSYYFQVAGFDKAVFDSGPPSAEFPPDEPSFPFNEELGRRFPPFHYSHPTTGQALRTPTSDTGKSAADQG